MWTLKLEALRVASAGRIIWQPACYGPSIVKGCDVIVYNNYMGGSVRGSIVRQSLY